MELNADANPIGFSAEFRHERATIFRNNILIIIRTMPSGVLAHTTRRSILYSTVSRPDDDDVMKKIVHNILLYML